MSPLLMSRDDALALSRAIGSRVALEFGGSSPVGSVIGVLVDVDLMGRAVVDTGSHGRVLVPVADVTSWKLA